MKSLWGEILVRDGSDNFITARREFYTFGN